MTPQSKIVSLIGKMFLLPLFVVLTASSVYSQSEPETPYIQKQRALLKQFFMDLGIDYATAQRASSDDDFRLTIEPLIKQKMQSNSLRGIGLWNQLERDREDAKKLMNAEEREKDRIELLKKSKIEQDKNNQEAYLKSDAYNLKTIIKNKYAQWSIRGEYEKTSDYETRMNNKQNVVRDIISSSVQEYIKDLNLPGNPTGQKFRLDCYLGNYNADTEVIEIIFKHYRGLEFKGTISLSPEKAHQIKSGARTANVDGVLLTYTLALTSVQDKCYLGFYNHNLISSKIGVNVRIKDENGNKQVEYHEVTMAPLSLDFDTSFFSASNLEIDMKGNENITLKDIICEETK